MKEKTWFKTVSAILLITVVGFLLFYIAFILAAVVNFIFTRIMLLFMNGRIIHESPYFFLWHYVYITLVLLISWFFLKLKINDLFKAAYITMPTVVILAETGVQFFRIPWLVFTLGALFIIAGILFLYKKKCPWLYYFAVLYAAGVMLIVTLTGTDL